MNDSPRIIQPPETQNLFVGISIFFAILWMGGVLRRCGAVLQLRRALGTRRLVAIRGAGRRVRIFRLLGRNYLQRALARNHLQALVHTRQACPPKTMPSCLLPATPRASGIRTLLHTEGRFDAGVGGAGPLVGLVVEMKCLVDCTVELLWDVDLAFLGDDMRVDHKLPLLPASSGGGQRDLAGGRRRRPRMNREILVERATDGGRPSFPQSLLQSSSSLLSSAANTVRRAWSGRGSDVSGGAGDRVVVDPAGNARGTFELEVEMYDEEVGSAARTSGTGMDSSTDGASVANGDSGDDDPVRVDAAGEERRTSWNPAAGLGRLKVGMMMGGGVDGGGGLGWVSNRFGENGSGTRGPSGSGTGGTHAGGSAGNGVANGAVDRVGDCVGCGKRSAPRMLGSGTRSTFQTLPSECYFRVGGSRQQGRWARKVAGEQQDPQRLDSNGGVSDRDGNREKGVVVGDGGVEGTTSVEPGGTQRTWPNVRDSTSTERCSLAIIIRASGHGRRASRNLSLRRNRATHVVTRQVLLVQLKERDGPHGPQEPPQAQVLQHLVAISKGFPGDSEAVYSFAEVFGAGQGDSSSGEASTTQDNNTSSSSNGAGQVSSVVSSTSAQGAGDSAMGHGSDLPEECVICLTEPKDTLLLPCRHLCVCSECFRHVDKCPVCRSAFDNYIVLRGAPAPAPQVAAAPLPPSALSLVLPPTMNMSHPASTEAVVNAPRAARRVPGFVPGGGIDRGILEESGAPSHTGQAASRTGGGVLSPGRDALQASVEQDGVYSVVL